MMPPSGLPPLRQNSVNFGGVRNADAVRERISEVARLMRSYSGASDERSRRRHDCHRAATGPWHPAAYDPGQRRPNVSGSLICADSRNKARWNSSDSEVMGLRRTSPTAWIARTSLATRPLAPFRNALRPERAHPRHDVPASRQSGAVAVSGIDRKSMLPAIHSGTSIDAAARSIQESRGARRRKSLFPGRSRQDNFSNDKFMVVRIWESWCRVRFTNAKTPAEAGVLAKTQPRFRSAKVGRMGDEGFEPPTSTV